jgi:cyclophilin family peptidyl-prolyl cis-trans isomerase
MSGCSGWNPCLALVFVIGGTAVRADEPPAAAQAPAAQAPAAQAPAAQAPAAQAPAATAAPEAAAADWTAAEAEIDRIETRLNTLQAEFQAAQPDQQQKLRTEAMTLVDSIKTAFRKLGQAAPQAYAAKSAASAPGKERAESLAQQAMGLAYSENRYADALAIAQAMLQVDPQQAVAMNIAGVALFATHQFQQSVEMFERARQANKLIPELGGNYLDVAKSYVGYWEKEQQLRQKEAAYQGDAQLPRVRLKTTRGDVLLELFEDQAPNTVANFISLVEKGYYAGSPFHRVIPNFMAQGGTGGEKFPGQQSPGYTIECECYRPDARRHFAGTLSMAHAGKDTGGSQFFLTHLPTAHLDREIRPESVHTVFGRVVEGQEVVAAIQQGDEIVSAEVVRKRNHPYTPKTRPGG